MAYRAVQLYTFLNFCNNSPLPKIVLDCGAGFHDSEEPTLLRFHQHGYETHGIEILDDRVATALNYQPPLNVIKGDVRNIPFDAESMSFVYCYDTIFHMTNAHLDVAMGEIERVLKPEGLCFVNFLSVDDQRFGEGQQIGKGEYEQEEGGGLVIHTYHEDHEPDRFFERFTILLKEKRVLRFQWETGYYTAGYIDYIARKDA